MRREGSKRRASQPPSVVNATGLNRELVPYVTIFHFDPQDGKIAPKSMSEIRKRYEGYLAWIQRYHESVQMKAFAPMKSLLPNLSFLCGHYRLVYRHLAFAERKTYKQITKNHKKNAKLLSDLLNFVLLYPPTGEYVFVLNIVELKRKFTEPPEFAKLLVNYVRMKLPFINKLEILTENQRIIDDSIRLIVNKLAERLDPVTSMVPDSVLRYKIRYLLFSKNCVFEKPLKELIEGFTVMEPSVFVENLMNILGRMFDHLHMGSMIHNATLMVVVYRIIFDEVYPLSFLNQPPSRDFLGCLSDVLFSSLAIPEEFCHPFSLDKPPKESLPDFEPMKNAIRHLVGIQYCVNPLDILQCAFETVHQIDEAVSIITDGKVSAFPFEVSFGFFFACLLCTEIPDFVSIVEYVEAYTPRTGLCPDLEYARAKLSASLMRCKELVT